MNYVPKYRKDEGSKKDCLNWNEILEKDKMRQDLYKVLIIGHDSASPWMESYDVLT